MNYSILLDMAAEFGYQLAMCGAETFRIEDSICRIFAAYDIESEVFAIPNCLTVSIKTKDQNPMTRMRRIGFHGNNLDAVEKLSDLSRRICKEKPDAVHNSLTEMSRSFKSSAAKLRRISTRYAMGVIPVTSLKTLDICEWLI